LRKSPADRFQSASDLRAAIVAAGAARIADDGPSIAVLPFANTSADKENDYFSDGLTEEIINALTHIPGLKVIARTSAFAFRGKEQDIRTIAEALGVRTVLEGSVRRAGNRIRVTTQLINADDGSHLWSERYDREMEDVFAIQDQIATALAAALETKFVVQADASRPHTPVLDAYHAVLRARHYLSKLTRKSMPQARECLRGAIALDPGYALPHSVLGGSFVTPAIFGMIPAHEAMPPARAAYQKALEIDPMLSEALVGLAAISMLYDYDWPAASGLFARAMTRGPLVGGARATYGQFLYFTGQAEAALQEHQQAVLGDPLNLTLRSMLAWALMIAGRIDEAASECRRILELNDRYSVGSFQLGLTQAACGDFQAALESAEKAHTATPWSLAVSGFTAGLLTLTGNPQRAEIVGQALGNGMVYGAPLGFVHYHLVRSEAELAAKWVEKAIEQRDPMLLFVLKAPLGAPLRQSAAWASLSATLFG
jgi:serine/threonine-protein kinase